MDFDKTQAESLANNIHDVLNSPEGSDQEKSNTEAANKLLHNAYDSTSKHPDKQKEVLTTLNHQLGKSANLYLEGYGKHGDDSYVLVRNLNHGNKKVDSETRFVKFTKEGKLSHFPIEDKDGKVHRDDNGNAVFPPKALEQPGIGANPNNGSGGKNGNNPEGKDHNGNGPGNNGSKGSDHQNGNGPGNETNPTANLGHASLYRNGDKVLSMPFPIRRADVDLGNGTAVQKEAAARDAVINQIKADNFPESKLADSKALESFIRQGRKDVPAELVASTDPNYAASETTAKSALEKLVNSHLKDTGIKTKPVKVEFDPASSETTLLYKGTALDHTTPALPKTAVQNGDFTIKIGTNGANMSQEAMLQSLNRGMFNVERVINGKPVLDPASKESLAVDEVLNKGGEVVGVNDVATQFAKSKLAAPKAFQNFETKGNAAFPAGSKIDLTDAVQKQTAQDNLSKLLTEHMQAEGVLDKPLPGKLSKFRSGREVKVILDDTKLANESTAEIPAKGSKNPIQVKIGTKGESNLSSEELLKRAYAQALNAEHQLAKPKNTAFTEAQTKNAESLYEFNKGIPPTSPVEREIESRAKLVDDSAKLNFPGSKLADTKALEGFIRQGTKDLTQNLDLTTVASTTKAEQDLSKLVNDQLKGSGVHTTQPDVDVKFDATKPTAILKADGTELAPGEVLIAPNGKLDIRIGSSGATSMDREAAMKQLLPMMRDIERQRGIGGSREPMLGTPDRAKVDKSFDDTKALIDAKDVQGLFTNSKLANRGAFRDLDTQFNATFKAPSVDLATKQAETENNLSKLLTEHLQKQGMKETVKVTIDTATGSTSSVKVGATPDTIEVKIGTNGNTNVPREELLKQAYVQVLDGESQLAGGTAFTAEQSAMAGKLFDYGKNEAAVLGPAPASAGQSSTAGDHVVPGSGGIPADTRIFGLKVPTWLQKADWLNKLEGPLAGTFGVLGIGAGGAQIVEGYQQFKQGNNVSGSLDTVGGGANMLAGGSILSMFLKKPPAIAGNLAMRAGGIGSMANGISEMYNNAGSKDLMSEYRVGEGAFYTVAGGLMTRFGGTPIGLGSATAAGAYGITRNIMEISGGDKLVTAGFSWAMNGSQASIDATDDKGKAQMYYDHYSKQITNNSTVDDLKVTYGSSTIALNAVNNYIIGVKYQMEHGFDGAINQRTLQHLNELKSTLQGSDSGTQPNTNPSSSPSPSASSSPDAGSGSPDNNSTPDANPAASPGSSSSPDAGSASPDTNKD